MDPGMAFRDVRYIWNVMTGEWRPVGVLVQPRGGGFCDFLPPPPGHQDLLDGDQRAQNYLRQVRHCLVEMALQGDLSLHPDLYPLGPQIVLGPLQNTTFHSGWILDLVFRNTSISSSESP